MLRDFINLWFPSYCFSCDNALVKGEEFLCTRCYYDLPIANDYNEDQNQVSIKFYGKIPISKAVAFLKFSRKGMVQKLLHKLKYQNQPEIGEYLGKEFGNLLKREEIFDTIDLILPVPLHRRKLKQRGYNQSDYLAKGLSSSLHIAWDPGVLNRTVYSKTQTRKSRMDRWKNVSEIFELKDPAKIENKHLLIIDDVVTSGATLEACGRVAIDKCASLSIATLASA